MVDSKGATPLCIAAKQGHDKVAQLLLQEEDIQVNHMDKDGYTPLTLATLKGHLKVVELLLRRKDIQINIQTRNGNTPLIIAVSEGYTNIAKLLLQNKNLLMEKANNNGETPLKIAHETWQFELKSLLKRKLKRTFQESEACFVCLDRKPEVILSPCGHNNLCSLCAHQWRREKDECPLDRIPIAGIKSLSEYEKVQFFKTGQMIPPPKKRYLQEKK